MIDHEEQIARLRSLANTVRNYQLQREWSDTRLCREIPHVGHSKTYKRILELDDPLEEMDVARQTANYQNAVELITARAGKERAPEPEYQDFRNIVAVRKAVASAFDEDSIARFVCVEGENGTGKDAAQRAMLATWPKVTAAVEAHELWRDSLAVPLSDMLQCLNIRQKGESGSTFEIPHFPAQRLEVLLAELSKRKLILNVNEAQSMGPRGLNLCKHIINKTPTVLTLYCIPKLLKDLIRIGYEEAAQLFGNRLCRRVRLETPAADEIMIFLERRGVTFAKPKDEAECAKRLEDLAPGFGNWRFITRVSRRARIDAAGKPILLEGIVDSITKAQNECVAQARQQ